MKVSQAELSEVVESAQQGLRAVILDSAEPPGKPDRSPVIIIALGLFASLGLTVLTGLALEFFDYVFITSDELEREFQVPVFASIPKV